jgi:formylglycine-generating enzyme required for sulfatase activity
MATDMSSKRRAAREAAVHASAVARGVGAAGAAPAGRDRKVRSDLVYEMEQANKEDLKAKVAKINDYVWARYIDVTDDYPHQLDENEALQTLEEFYSDPAEQDNQDAVYLAVLLFERGFVDEENKAAHFKRAYRIFDTYRRVTGEEDWDVVEDRLEDIRAYFEEEGIDPDAQPEGAASPEGMVLVPEGKFLFGESREEVDLPAFYIDLHPVTNEEYLRFCEETGYRKPRFHDDERYNAPKQPVVGISLLDALQYCRWAGKDLPTEQQWEKAARGTDGRKFPWGDEDPDPERAVFEQPIDAGRPGEVGTLEKGASACGCFDMSGSVWEWTVSAPGAGAAKKIEQRVLRGGCYEDPPEFLTTFSRLEDDQKIKSEIVGFRCVMNRT